MKRRQFLRNMMALPLATGSFLYGNPDSFINKAHAAISGKTLVVIFQRGGCDGLNVVVPYADENYYNLRPTIAIPAPTGAADSALNLDGFFGLHPGLSPLHQLYQSGVVGVMPAVHYENASRSHFDSQDYIESAVYGGANDGWLNRHLTNQYLDNFEQAGAIRAVSFGNDLAHSLRGSTSVLSFNDLSSFSFNNISPQYFNNLQAVYNQSVSTEHKNRLLVHQDGRLMLAKLQNIMDISSNQYTPENNVTYPGNSYGNQLQQVAQLIKSNVGLELATVSLGGWDTHTNQGGVTGTQANRLNNFSSGIHALYHDLGQNMDDVVILTMTEFGRTAKQNASAGTDHGNASSWFVIGNSVRGGIYGDWPGLQTEQLYRERYLAHNIEYTDVFAEVLVNHLQNTNLSSVLPGQNYQPIGFLS
ncbi:MAG: DUF1501 domain-containing protein [Pseudomonadota bacterium]